MKGRATAWRSRGSKPWRGVIRYGAKSVGCGYFATRGEAVEAARRCAVDPNFQPITRGPYVDPEVSVENLQASIAPRNPVSGGARRLALAMIQSALDDLTGGAGRHKKSSEASIARAGARAWVRGDIGWGVTSFRGVCATLGIEVEALRRWLLGQAKVAEGRNGGRRAETAVRGRAARVGARGAA